MTISTKTSVQDVKQMALEKFGINVCLVFEFLLWRLSFSINCFHFQDDNADKYYLVQVLIDQDMSEHILNADQLPLQLIRHYRNV